MHYFEKMIVKFADVAGFLVPFPIASSSCGLWSQALALKVFYSFEK